MGSSMNNQYKTLQPCVILAQGTHLGTVVEMLRPIGKRGVPVHVILIGDDHNYAWVYRKSRYCKTTHQIPFHPDAKHICEEILEWGRSQQFPMKPLLLPMTDMACTQLAAHMGLLEDCFVVCMPDGELVQTLVDKTRANPLARECGLDVPKDGHADSRETLAELAGKMTMPVIVKPTWWAKRGKEYFKAGVCETYEQVLSIGGKLIDNGATVMVQEYIHGEDSNIEVYMFYRSLDGQAIHGCTGIKIRQMPPGTGIMASGQACNLPHVAEISDAFLERIDYRGLGGIEYKRCGGKSYFIEMSVRPEGFQALAVKAGVDLPWLAYSDMALGQMRREKILQKEAYFISIREYFSLWLKHRREIPVLQEVLRILFSGKLRFDIWAWDDPLPCLAMMAVQMKDGAKKLFQQFDLRKP